MSRKFWEIRNQTETSAELILYGDISDTSWWGDEITPTQFSKDLNSLGNINDITVRINSGGGDVFAAQAIGNLLEQHPANVTAKIDGLCASAATIIACHCSKVIAANDSTYMIHPVRMGICGYKNAVELQKYIEALATIRENIVSLYAKKTGREKDDVAALMDAESWWTGEEAKNNGFVDELTDNGDESIIENRNGLLFINSVNMNMPFEKVPKFVQNHLKKTENFVNKPKDRKKEEYEVADTIKTVEDLRNAYPELVNQIEEAASNAATEAERTRMKEIEDMAMPGSEKLTNQAKYDKPMSAADYAKEVVKNAKAQGMQYMKDALEDTKNSGMGSIRNEAGESGTDDEFMNALKGLGKK